MTATLLTFPVFRAFDSNGAPLAGGLLYSYQAGTTTPLATYVDQAGVTQNTNPVVLDSTGTANVWLGDNIYKLVLKDSDGIQQWSVDNIQSEGNQISTAVSAVYSDLANTSNSSKGDALIGVKSTLTNGSARTQHSKNADIISVTDFGADPTGANDSFDAFTAAFGAATSVYVPPGTYLLSSTVRVPNNKSFSMIGVPGVSILKATGSNACIGGTTAGDGLTCNIDGIIFTASDPGVASGIYGPSTIEMAWWNVTNCSFSQKLKYGLNANMISSEFKNCNFGLYERGEGTIHSAIKQTGQLSPDDYPINIQTFRNCEFTSSIGADYGLEFDYGAKILFDACIFEQNVNTASLIYFNGVLMPVFQNCWFEHNAGTSSIKLDFFDSSDAFTLRVENCSINVANGPSSYFIDWGTTVYKDLIWVNNAYSFGIVPVTNSMSTTNVLMAGGNFSNNPLSGMVANPDDPFTFGKGIRSFTTETSVPVGVATTVATLPTVGIGTYLVSVAYNFGAASELSSFAIIQTDESTCRSALTSNGTYVAISLASGNNVQITTNSILTTTFKTTVTRVA